MSLFDRLFYSGAMIAVFSDESRLQKMLDFESALASAEAAAGVIPSDAAAVIANECKVGLLDLASLQEEASRAGNLAIPLVKQLSEVVNAKNADAARYVHWGATSQDVIDTGFVLQAREALLLIEDQLQQLNAELAAKAERYAATLMPGRTWLQHAVPITFGWKAAGWLDAILRHQTRLREVRSRALTIQFGGAVGTLAALGANGPEVLRVLAETLQLAQPDISWHASRDRLGEIATMLGLIVGTLGKMARDISLLMQTEVTEAFEPAEDGRGGSSTMPQKRNPVACSAVLAAAVRVPGLVATVLASMVQEQERGIGNWQAEWETLPEIFNLTSGALEKMVETIAGLDVDCDRMSANLDRTQGLIMAEAVAMALAPRLGKPAAHALVERACRIALEDHRHLRDVLHEDVEFGNLISVTERTHLLDAKSYLGITRRSIDRVLARASAGGVKTRSSWIDLANVRIRYEWSGPADKPVLVLSHSLGADMTMWDGQVAEFSEHFHVLRYDTRGHGQSSTPSGPYNIELLSRDLLALLDAFGVESCCFCGLSMGGAIGQWLGLNAAARIHKLVLSNTAATIGSVESWNSRIESVLSGGLASIVPGVLDRWFTAGFRESHPDTMARIHAAFAATDPDGYMACCAALRDFDQRAAVRHIQVPVLVIAGTQDLATPPEDARSLAESVASGRYVELNASHLSNIEAKEEFNSVVLEFLLS